jgi:hypothetical protein
MANESDVAGDRAASGKLAVAVMAGLILVGSVALAYFMHRSTALLVRNLDSPDTYTVSYSLQILKDHRDPAGLAKARGLMDSGNADIAQDAALYVGAMGKQESIPYLIKLLKTVQGRELREIAVDLTAMTGEDFGANYDDWEKWRLAKQK